MKKISLAALVAAMMLPALAIAQDASVSVSTEVSVSTPNVSSVLSSAESQLSSTVSSAVSSASSELSSVVSSSSEMASSQMSSGEVISCDTLDTTTMAVTPIDAAALAAVTSVSVFAVDDCSGIDTLAGIDGAATAALGSNQMVIDAFAAAGQPGAEIVAYMLDGTSLTVYVRTRNS